MKTILALSLMLGSFNAFATTADKIDRLWAVLLSHKLKKIEQPKDFVSTLPFSRRDAETIEKQIKDGQMKNFVKPIVSMPNETTVMLQMGSQVAKMDFREFHKGFVYLNGHKVQLDKNSDYFRLRMEAERVLGHKSALLDQLLPQAEAASLETPLADFVGASMGSSNYARKILFLDPSAVNGDNIEQALQHAYAMEVQSARDRANIRNGSANLSTYRFKCKAGKASDLYDGDVVRNGKLVPLEQSDTLLHINPGGTAKKQYIYSSIGCKQATADANLIITSKSEPTCPVDANIKSQDIFQFRQFADLCCHKSSCESHVNSILQQMSEELTGNNTHTIPPEDSGAVR